MNINTVLNKMTWEKDRTCSYSHELENLQGLQKDLPRMSRAGLCRTRQSGDYWTFY